MKWFAWSVALIISVLVIWYIVPRDGQGAAAASVSLKDFPEPVAVAEWEDGYRFEVLRVGVGAVEDGSMVEPSGSLTNPVRTSTRTFIDGKMTAVETEYFDNGGVPTGLRCAFTDEIPGLMLICRIIDGSGKALKTDAVMSEGIVVDDAIADQGSYALGPLRYRGSDAMKAAKASGKPGVPDVLIQVRDPEFGWITGEGLLTLDDGGGHRLLAVFPAWPRITLMDNKQLEFRVLRAGVEEAAEIQISDSDVMMSGSMPTPGAPVKVIEFPSVIDGKDYTIKLDDWAFEKQEESYPFVGVDSEFIDRTPGDLGRLKDEGFRSFSQSDFYWVFAESDDGNIVAAQMKEFEELGHEPGFSLPLGADDFVTVEGRMSRNVGYPRRRDECVLLGSGEVASDGKTIEIIMDGEADKIGLKRFDVVPDSSADSILASRAEKKKVGFQGFRLEYEIEMGKGAAASYATRLGEFLEWEPVVFLDDEEYSAGVVGLGNRGTSETITGTREIRGGSPFEVRIKAGQKIRVGLAKRKEPEAIRIRFPVGKDDN